MNAIPRRYRVQVYGTWDERRVAALRHPNNSACGRIVREYELFRMAKAVILRLSYSTPFHR